MSQESSSTEGGAVRLSVNLSREAAEAIREIQERRGITITEVIRRAISTQKYIEDATDKGAKILIEQPGEPLKELVFIR